MPTFRTYIPLRHPLPMPSGEIPPFDPRRAFECPRPRSGITSAIMSPGGGFRDGEAPEEKAGPQEAADNRRIARRIAGQSDSADLRGTTTESHQGDRREMG